MQIQRKITYIVNILLRNLWLFRYVITRNGPAHARYLKTYLIPATQCQIDNFNFAIFKN